MHRLQSCFLALVAMAEIVSSMLPSSGDTGPFLCCTYWKGLRIEHMWLTFSVHPPMQVHVGVKVDIRHFLLLSTLFLWDCLSLNMELSVSDGLLVSETLALSVSSSPHPLGLHTHAATHVDLGSELGSSCSTTVYSLPSSLINNNRLWVAAVWRSWLHFPGSNGNWVLILWPQNHCNIFYPSSQPHALLHTAYPTALEFTQLPSHGKALTSSPHQASGLSWNSICFPCGTHIRTERCPALKQHHSIVIHDVTWGHSNTSLFPGLC